MELKIDDIDLKKIPEEIVSKITKNISGWMLAGGNTEDPYIQEQLQTLKYYGWQIKNVVHMELILEK